MTGGARRRGWWRENRLWLPALPLALAALVVASSYNLKTFWFEEGLHDEVASAGPGEVASATLEFEDALGPTDRTFRVRLDGLRTGGSYPTNDLEGSRATPEGVDAVIADLDWEAEPDQVLRGCTVTLVDSDGRRYLVPETLVQSNLCVPEEHPGPQAPLLEGQERGVPEGEERPPTWSTAPVFLVPEGRRITRVLVSWERPRYVALSVS